jgi:eukaryotic-like serine/threonine-protein kinase
VPEAPDNRITHWQRARALFHACVELNPAQQDALLARECVDDPDLKAEVESLLASLAASKTFMEVPAAATEYCAEPSWIGRTLGAYRVISLLAAGGMGEVYRAVRADGLYPQAVAIKLIRGELAGEMMLSRFRAERQILASLQHPNIARILDAGITETGLPYIIMELIEGEPIDRYCETRSLPLRQRLELFMQVCAAVHFAHQHLTVHRDLKPGNILVTNQGTVKLLDFGIAKVLDAGAAMDAPTQLHAMTPEYSSPEQIRREPITTASDTYSLGVILYRLLTGRSPYRSSSNDPYALAHEVCETQPLKPSAHADEATTLSGRKQLRGDLDSIVLMALRKERDQRYESVQQFSADVQRYLDNRTVSARPRTWRYVTSRFIVRNRALSLAILLIVVVLIAGILATQRQARIAAAERDRAQRHFDSVRHLANSFMFDIHDEIAKLPGSTKARQLLVNKALTYLDLLSKEPGGDSALQLELAEAYLRVGRVQGQVGFNNLGDHAAALKSYKQAIALLEQALGKDPSARPEYVQLARAYNLASANLEALGRRNEELEMISKEIELMQRRLSRDPDSTEALARMGHVLYRRSQFRSSNGDADGAVADAQRAVELLAKNPDFKRRDDLSFSYSNLGAILLKREDSASRSRALDALRKALATMQAALVDSPDDVTAQRHFAVTAADLGTALVTVGRPREGLPYLEQSLPIFRKLYEADRSSRLARLDMVETEQNVGNLWVSLGDSEKAIDHCRTALQVLGPRPASPESDLEISAAYAEAQTDLSAAYAAAAEAGGAESKQRTQYWHDALLAADASLQTARAVLASKPDLEGDYHAFIERDKMLQTRATHEVAQLSTTNSDASAAGSKSDTLQGRSLAPGARH